MDKPDRPLRRGWTTGTCAAAAAKAAYAALVTGEFPDPVEVTLPRGERPSFALALTRQDQTSAAAGVVKDAGDDPDVTHGALVIATVRAGAPGAGVTFRAGEGVGTVTRAGLPLPPGEPAINPVPRRMIRDAIAEVAAAAGRAADAEVEISIPGGAALAAKTLNGRLGIVGGLSILGTTGIVVPYSCAAWIHSIQRGIDVARAAGLTHIAGSTGSSSEAAVQKLYDLPEIALIDMGDFVGGMLKYLRAPQAAARHHRRRRRQDDKARPGPDRSAFQARRSRSARCLPSSCAGRAARRRCVRVSWPPTMRRKLSPLRTRKASRSATPSHARRSRRRRGSSKAATSRSRLFCSIATESWSGGRRNLVIARSASDEAIQGRRHRVWIASRSLSSGRPLRAGPVGSQ